MRSVGYVVAMMIGAVAAVGAQSLWEARSLEVVRVIDGDTVRIAAGESVRLAGFDAPERSRRWARCETERTAGQAATRRLRRLIATGRVRLVLETEREKYGRLLGALMIDDQDVAEIAIAEGWGQRWDGQGPKPDWCGGGK